MKKTNLASLLSLYFCHSFQLHPQLSKLTSFTWNTKTSLSLTPLTTTGTPLSSDQAEALRRSDLVLGVYGDTLYPLHITRTPKFLNQNTQFLEQASHDVIIGVLSGPSIKLRRFGSSEPGANFRPTVCNKKLIGARSFFRGYKGLGYKWWCWYYFTLCLSVLFLRQFG